MKDITFYNAGTSASANQAATLLLETGAKKASVPGPEVTDLLLDIPSFSSPGILNSGENISAILPQLPPDVRIWGGKLKGVFHRYSFDLLSDPIYLAENAAITADCALRLAGPLVKSTWKNSSVLILGWGRIGKQLSRMLKALECRPRVYARSEADLALLRALGYIPVSADSLVDCLPKTDLIYNTIPVPILSEADVSACPNCITVDLASDRGLIGPDVIVARGLPGKMAPDTSAELIVETILRLGKDVF